MANTRLNCLPNKSFLDLRATLQDHLEKIAQLVDDRNFQDLCDPGIFRWFNGIIAWGGSDRRQHLAFGSGKRASRDRLQQRSER